MRDPLDKELPRFTEKNLFSCSGYKGGWRGPPDPTVGMHSPRQCLGAAEEQLRTHGANVDQAAQWHPATSL